MHRLARASLDIGAIKLSTEEPFLWTSGYRMPIYNDNRRHLGHPENRALITEAFAHMVRQEGLHPEIIVGTSTAGIAPAASLAQKLQLPLALLHAGEPYLIHEELLPQVSAANYDAIASTCPWAIGPAVQLANKVSLPFMYVRAAKKDHGLQQQVEGVPLLGQEVLLLDFYRNESYAQAARQALESTGAIVTGEVSAEVSATVRPYNISGMETILIEDLVSTGGSSLKELLQLRTLGAHTRHCLSIFNYGLAEA